MIKYNLKCHNEHEFESWFSNSYEFEKLNKKGLLECIYCSSTKINKSIMAPMVSSTKKKVEQFEITNQDFKNEKDKLLKLRKYIEKNFNYIKDLLGENLLNEFIKKISFIQENNKKAMLIVWSKLILHAGMSSFLSLYSRV